MAKGKGAVIGHINCPLCGLDADVKEDRNGNPYAFCPDCTMQLLTHGGQRAELLRARMRPIIDGEVMEQDNEPAPTETKPAPQRRTLMG